MFFNKKATSERYSQSNIITKRPFSWQRTFHAVKHDSFAWLLIAPSLIFLFIFGWAPLVQGVQTAFYQTEGFELVKFIGLQNFREVMSDSIFLTAAKNTFTYAIWSVAFFFIPVIVAIILNEMAFMKNFFRMAIYFPCLVPGIVTALMWKIMLDPSKIGLFNIILMNMGMENPLPFLQDPKVTIMLIMLTGVWGGYGSTVILYLADLQSVNLDLYEAAALDGAGVLRKVWHITLPHMSALVRLFFIMNVIGIFQIFAQPLAMTQGGPSNASLSLQLMAYRYAFDQFRIGRSTAVSVITMVFLLILTAIYFRVSKASETE